MTVALATEFDVREYTRTAHGSLRAGFDLAAVAATSIAPDVTRLLAVLQVLEGATMAHLRNLLVTATHKDARVTAFLVTWAYEKFWIADALGALVEANGARPLASGHATTARPRRGPVRRSLAGFVQGRSIVGAHMAVGLIDGWVLDAAYRRAIDRAGDGALAEALTRILMVKERHTRFFDEEARHRLAASPRTVRLTRSEVRSSGMPVGARALGPTDRRFFARFVWSGQEGSALADGIDRRIRDLPGTHARTAARVRAELSR
ncbi:hypothetical protein [Agromyces laixinhei]|uniref:hypothetical protein n=1 Tax=Agromyces laixinhei TaxID=2585717 RepID=UPI0012ED58DE|nr:hypothetical protein [Agromyces laixinhei]